LRIEAAPLRIVYNALLYLVLPFLPLRLWWRGRREPGYRHHIGERFGFYRQGEAAVAEKPLLWIHAVSLGETRASEPLVKALQRRLPGYRFLITHMTATGRQAGETLFPGAVTAFLPYDYPFAVRRFIEHFQPRLGILMETEVWPNLIRWCSLAGIPLVLANARLSERSARRYGLIAALAEQAFGALGLVAAQSRGDAERLQAAGARSVVVTGNLKFDIGNPAEAAPLAAQLRAWFGTRPVLLLASTREGEETLVLDALARRPLPRGALVVIVPRHPQRFDEVARILANRVLTVVRRSENRAVPEGTSYFLGDSVGEMAAYYLACDAAFVGGSLVPVGGQNLIEASAAGTPVIVGPSTFNFSDAARLAIEAGAALRVADAKELVETAAGLLADEGRRRNMSDAGRAFAEAHRGAAERVAELIAERVRAAAART
jgi:3-deoxy-D-manno-octulosonic-acid transferase